MDTVTKLPRVDEGHEKNIDILDTVNTAVDSSHDVNELIVNIVTPIVSGLVLGVVSGLFKKK